MAKENLLATPLHGIVIPGALVLVGIYIVAPKYLLHGVFLVLFLAAAKVLRGTFMLLDGRWHSAELISKIEVMDVPDTYIYRFYLEPSAARLKLKPGRQLELRYTTPSKDKEFSALLTPINEEMGNFDVLVTARQSNPLSLILDAIEVHTFLDFRGPMGGFEYVKGMTPNLGMIAQGDQIAPMLSVISHIVKTAEDTTNMVVVYINERPELGPLRADLEELDEMYPHFKLFHTSTLDSDLSHYFPGDPSQWIVLKTPALDLSHLPRHFKVEEVN